MSISQTFTINNRAQRKTQRWMEKKTRKQLTSKEYEAQKSSSGREEDWSKESRVCGKLESLAQKLPSHRSVRKFPSLPPIKRIHRVPVCVGLQCNTVTNSTLVTRIIGFVPLLCSSTAPPRRRRFQSGWLCAGRGKYSRGARA